MGGVVAGAGGNVVIGVGDCVVTLIPTLGGKISSLVVKGRELLQAPLHAYGPRNQSMSFAEGDAGGWDECLPSVAGCTVETVAGPVIVPDHGDLWRVPWKVLERGESSITLRGKCVSLPLELTRSLIVSERAAGWELELLYSLTNSGSHAVPWSWSAHPLFAVEAGDRIVLPASIQTLRVEGSAAERLGRSGDTLAWPMAKLADGNEADLREALGADSGIGDKLFAGPLKSGNDGWCSLERKAAGLRLTMKFEVAATPYLGLWICYGGWPEADGPKQVCVAIEPCTGPVDSLAATGVWTRVLEAGDTVSWPMTLKLEKLAGA